MWPTCKYLFLTFIFDLWESNTGTYDLIWGDRKGVDLCLCFLIQVTASERIYL